MRSAKEPEKAEEERKSAIRTKMEANKKDRIMIQSRKPKKINQEYREILEERKDMECMCIWMEHYMRVSGKMMSRKELEQN